MCLAPRPQATRFRRLMRPECSALGHTQHSFGAYPHDRSIRVVLLPCCLSHCANNHNSLPTPITDEELLALSAMMGTVPEGDRSPLHAPALPNPNPELAMLETLLASPTRSLPIAPAAPSDLSFRFPHDRPLPQGFSLSRNEGPSAMPTAGPSHPESPSNPFSATPLHIPADFSPSKVKGAKASSPPTAVHITKKKAGAGTTKPKAGTRASSRVKPQASYADLEDTADDEL